METKHNTIPFYISQNLADSSMKICLKKVKKNLFNVY